MFIAVTNTVRKKGRLLCHVAERTFTSGRMVGGRAAIFAAGHLPARQSTSADVPQTQDPIISTMEDAQHNQEPAISIAAEDIQGLELSGDTNTAMPQIHDSTADTNANEEQAQAS